MKKESIPRLAACLLFAAVPAIVIWSASQSGAPVSQAEELAANGIPFGEELAELGRGLKTFGGRREVNGVFVGRNGLMKNIDPPDDGLVTKNLEGILTFADWAREYQKPSYVMLLPTAAGVTQQNLPRFARGVTVNQRDFIENVYNRASAGASYIDAYSALLDRRGQYIYYRTEDNLTSLGGFYVYAAVLSRLGVGAANLGEFDIEYAANPFYGDLYRQTGYRGVSPDAISIFKYSESNRVRHEYLVLHQSEAGEKLYHTLFPTYASALRGEMGVFLGGLSPVVDIRCSPGQGQRLLLFGDKTAVSYLPFLANACSRVTFVDLTRETPAPGEISPEDYDGVIFAYGVETFMHTDVPSTVASLVEE